MSNLEEADGPHASSEIDSRLLWGALGIFAGVAVCARARKMLFARQRDDDRPPIIVRGGSINFESGTAKHPGKPWKRDSSDRKHRPDHPNGKPVKRFRLYFVGGGTRLPPVETASFTVEYDPRGGGKGTPMTYTVEIPRTGRPVPTITGEDLKVDPQKPWRLHAGSEGQGTVLSITVGGTKYSNDDGTLSGTEVWAESIR